MATRLEAPDLILPEWILSYPTEWIMESVRLLFFCCKQVAQIDMSIGFQGFDANFTFTTL